MESHTHRVEQGNGKEIKKSVWGEKMGKEHIKNRKIEDGLLLVDIAQIYGRTIRALIDSGATICFMTPSCVTAVGLKGTPRDIFLELGNGEKYLSRGMYLTSL